MMRRSRQSRRNGRRSADPDADAMDNVAFFVSMSGLMMIAEIEISRHVYGNKSNLPKIIIKSVQSASTLFCSLQCGGTGR